MKVVAALAWWSERVEDLEACIRGLSAIADRVVAVDGAYVRYPGATVRSRPEEASTIKRVARETGIGCQVYEPSRLWAGQVEKRSFLMGRAAVDADWVMVVDADHVLRSHDPATGQTWHPTPVDRKAARAFLEAVDPTDDVIQSRFWTPANPDRPMGENAASQWHAAMSDTVVELGHIIRALPDLRADKQHWTYRATKNGQPVDLSYGVVGLGGPVMPAPYVVEHRTLFRTREQVEASRWFIRDREMVVARTGQEDDSPELPRPFWPRWAAS